MAVDPAKYTLYRNQGYSHYQALALADPDTDFTPSVAGAVADPAALTSTTVDAANASAPGAVYAQAEAASTATLANETKGDLNALRADVAALRGTVASLQASLRAAGLMTP